jgi:hypothetical protein
MPVSIAGDYFIKLLSVLLSYCIESVQVTQIHAVSRKLFCFENKEVIQVEVSHGQLIFECWNLFLGQIIHQNVIVVRCIVVIQNLFV